MLPEGRESPKHTPRNQRFPRIMEGAATAPRSKRREETDIFCRLISRNFEDLPQNMVKHLSRLGREFLVEIMVRAQDPSIVGWSAWPTGTKFQHKFNRNALKVGFEFGQLSVIFLLDFGLDFHCVSRSPPGSIDLRGHLEIPSRIHRLGR